ncbi:MAG: MBL fold metallo-hydrolase [Planctomycetota bacterium]|nr:MBL fold metallo-hydrolase [Planctomycetota bacterium]
MKLLSLGHSCFLLEMVPADRAEGVRILGDPWLSDHVAGDLLGRFPRLRFDVPSLQPLHAIFLSHSHTDHFDPESLLRLWRGLSPTPSVILPQSLEYLEPLLCEFLDDPEIVRLREGEPQEFRGLTISGFFNREQRRSNEDDAMVLRVESAREVFLNESDALLPFYDPQVRGLVSSILGRSGVETACFLTTRNEEAATMAMVDARDLEDRQSRLSRSIEATYADIEEIYAPQNDGDPDEADGPEGDDRGDDGDVWQNDRLVRLVGGQGICFPQDVRSDWNRVLFPIRREDRVRMEREIAEQLACRHTTEEFVPGEIHHLEGGRLVRRERCADLELLDREDERLFDPALEIFEDFPAGPLIDERRDEERQRQKILEALNGRFLPHLIGARQPPVEHLLAASGGEYLIRLRYGVETEPTDRDYRITFGRLRFEESPASRDREPDEFYWANDVDDFLEGRCDEFSTFCRRRLGGASQRFWTSLGLPFLNNDLVEKKLRLHFERAVRGETLADWVLSFYRGWSGEDG